jgi:hypothetical protein
MDRFSMVRRALAVLTVLVSLSVLTGCQKGEAVPVTGVLKWQGKPLPRYLITFQPEKGRPSVAVSDDNGRFEMVYTDEQNGVVPGKHRVYVAFVPPTATYDPKLLAPPPEDREIREKYGPQNSQKQVEVTGPLTDFELVLD